MPSALRQLDRAVGKRDFVRTEIIATKDQRYYLLVAGRLSGSVLFGEIDGVTTANRSSGKSLSSVLKILAKECEANELILPTLTAEFKVPVDLLRNAWCEAFEVEQPSEDRLRELNQEFECQMQTLRDRFIDQLKERQLHEIDKVSDTITIPRLVMHFRAFDARGCGPKTPKP